MILEGVRPPDAAHHHSRIAVAWLVQDQGENGALENILNDDVEAIL